MVNVRFHTIGDIFGKDLKIFATKTSYGLIKTRTGNKLKRKNKKSHMMCNLQIIIPVTVIASVTVCCVIGIIWRTLSTVSSNRKRKPSKLINRTGLSTVESTTTSSTKNTDVAYGRDGSPDVPGVASVDQALLDLIAHDVLKTVRAQIYETMLRQCSSDNCYSSLTNRNGSSHPYMVVPPPIPEDKPVSAQMQGSFSYDKSQSMDTLLTSSDVNPGLSRTKSEIFQRMSRRNNSSNSSGYMEMPTATREDGLVNGRMYRSLLTQKSQSFHTLSRTTGGHASQTCHSNTNSHFPTTRRQSSCRNNREVPLAIRQDFLVEAQMPRYFVPTKTTYLGALASSTDLYTCHDYESIATSRLFPSSDTVHKSSDSICICETYI